jgi:hypothetical protein
MAPLRSRFSLPPLPSHPQRQVVDQALDGAYRRIVFLPSSQQEEVSLLSDFFNKITAVVDDTMNLLLEEPCDLKICPHLTLLMYKKVGGDATDETEVTIHLGLKAIPLTNIQHNPETMQRQFEERLENFLLRGSGFRVKRVVTLEWEVVQFDTIAFHVGHGKIIKLPPRLAAKKAEVNVNNDGDDGFR